MGRHLYKYKLGIAEAVEEHSANIKGFGSLEARIKANEEAPRYRKRLPFVTVAPNIGRRETITKKNSLQNMSFTRRQTILKVCSKSLQAKKSGHSRKLEPNTRSLKKPKKLL